MPRNTRNKIRNGHFRNKRFNIEGIKRSVAKMQAEEAAVLLNAVLLLLPWGLLFGFGVLVSPVYAQGGADVSTDLDTLLFAAGGVAVFILVVVFAIILKGKGKRE